MTTEQRRAVVREALTWIGTPYHHHARVKGAGVDCGMFLAEVYERAGVIPNVDPGPYPPDWHLHRDAQRYLGWVERFAQHQEGTPLPGDIVLHRFGRCISHGAIVVEWPVIVHSYIGLGVILDDAAVNLALTQRQVPGFWTMWGKA